MYQIKKMRDDTVLHFAAEELKKYLRMMMPDCGEIDISLDPEAIFGFRLGLLEDFGLPNEAQDVELDDIVHIDTDENGGILAGSNPRSVLFAVYRFLQENGCRWLYPGKDGEFIPRKAVEAICYHKMADHRIRAHTTEGDPTLEQALDYIDYQTKLGLNTYGLAGIYSYHNRYYKHRYNEKNRLPEPVDHSLVEQWQVLCEAELVKRGAIMRIGGHGWPAQVAGFDVTERQLYRDGKKEVPEHIRPKLAMMNGVRGLNRKDPFFTNLCWSQPELRSGYAKLIAQKAMENRQFQLIGVSMADTSHNHCECPECQKLRPSDFMVMILNEADEILTANNCKTKLFFSDYVDIIFPPSQMKIKNPDRFVFQHAAISRSYAKSLTADSVYPPVKEYVRNKWEITRTVEGVMAYYKEWRKNLPATGVAYEYHFWKHQYRDPGSMAMARRIYEDNMALKITDLDGCVEDGSNRSFFPNGFMDHIYCVSLWDREIDYEAELEDYFSHIYGKDWEKARRYLEKISAAFDHGFMCGEKSADLSKGEFYNPDHVKNLEEVKEITAESREFIKTHLAMPTRPQTVSWRLLWRHTEYCERFAEILMEVCLGHKKYAMEMLQKFFEDFGKYEFEMERYLDFGLAFDSLYYVVKNIPKVEF